ncbi:hypothetical protein RQP46_008074 [Phenoliferia psychrophenolica]
MATIHSLAPEILSDIFELAHDPHKPSTMKSASLVCRVWRDPAQRTLFLDVVVPIFLGGPGGPATEQTKSVIRRWEDYRSTRLYPPRRVELQVNMTTPKSVGLGGRTMYWVGFEARLSFPLITGVKNFHISGGNVAPNILSDPNLAGLESLTIQNSVCSESLLDAVRFIPTSVLDVSIILALPNGNDDLVPALATVHNLHHLTFEFIWERKESISLLESLAGSLPTSIERLSISNVSGDGDSNRIALSALPLPETQDVFSNDRLPKLARLDFTDCKRKDLEDAAAAADLLAECERKSIRVVCWEEFI